MKKVASKIICFFIASVIVAINCFVPDFAVFGEDVNTTKINTSLKMLGNFPVETLADGTKIYEIYTGASANLYANFEVSGTDVDIRNATVKIWIPKDGKNYIKSVKFTGSYNASSVVFSGNNDPNEFSVSYNFNRLRGGMVGGYPFSFRFENIITPPNVEQPVYFSIYDENGNLVYNKEEKIVIRSLAFTNYSAAKFVERVKLKSFNYRKSPDYLDTNAPTETPAEPEETKAIFYNQFVPLGSGTGGDEGEYRSTKIKVVDHLPEGAVFLEDNETNIKYGWTKISDQTYQTVLDKSNPQYTKIFESKNFVVPIVLAFPNRPLHDFPSGDPNAPGKTTGVFTNISDFYYYTNDGDSEEEVKIEATEEERSASVSFFYKKYIEPKPVNTSYNWNRKIISGRENFVNIDNNPSQISIINGNSTLNLVHVPTMDFVNVFPEKNEDRLVWKTVTEVNQYTRQGYTYDGESLKRVLDTNQNVRTESTGFKDNGTYASNIKDLNSARMYYQDVVVRAELLKNATSDQRNSLEDLKQSKFWLFKSFSPQFGGHYFAPKDSTKAYGQEYVAPSVLVPVADHPFGLDEVIKINDKGGYYTALFMIATDDLSPDEVNAIKKQKVIPWEKIIEEYNDNGINKWRLKGLENNTGEEHSLRLKNVNLQQEFTFRPVKEGNISIAEDNSTFVAPHKFDFLSRFNEDVLKAKNDDDISTNPASIFYTFNPFSTIAGKEFDQTRPSRYLYEENIAQDFAVDTEYKFYPNNAKINLSVSGDQSYMYVDTDPEHSGSFTSKIFDARQDLTAKNVKGIVLLPSGVEYISTNSFGQALGEPEIVNNFKNTGRQAIIYSFGDIAVKANVEKSLGTVSYKVKITKKTKDSASTQEGSSVETWMSWENPSLIWSSAANGNGVIAEDSMDLNQNDNSREGLLKGTYNIFYFAPAEVIVSKYVSDDSSVSMDNAESASQWGTWTHDSRFIDIGSDVYFRMFLVNQYIKKIDRLSIVERMPALNDHKMVANEDGIYPLRGPLGSQTGSNFPVHLIKKLGEFQPNIDIGMFDFEYTLAPILSDTENPDPYAEKDIVMEDQWIKEADLDSKLEELGKTMADITGFRAVLKEGKTISGISEENRVPEGENPITWYQNHPQAGNTTSIFIPTRLPYDSSLDRNIPAYMSTAYKLANPGSAEYSGFSLNEGNEVRISNMYYTIGGTVFRDYKHTGDLTDDRVSNIKATLEFASEATVDGVTYHKGDEVPAKLVKAGKLNEENHAVEPIEGQEPTNTTLTDEKGNYYFVVYKRGKYQVRFDTDPDDPKQSFVQYGSNVGKLRANTNAPAPTDYPISPLTTTTRTAVDIDASPTIVNYNSDGSIDYLSGTLHNVANAAIDDQKRDLVVFKYGMDKDAAPDDLRVALSAKFKLTGVTDPTVTREFTTDTVTGEFRVEDLSYGEYILEETQAPAGLVKLDNPIKIVVSGQGVTFDQENPDASSYEFVNERIEVKNVVPKGKITITKNSSMASNKPLENVVFGIYQNGTPVLDENGEPLKATTNASGIAVFENLPAGTIYTIKEETAAAGHTTKWKKSETETVDLSQGIDVKLDLPLDVIQQAELNVFLSNIPYKATVKVKKADEDGKPLAGATFGIYNNEDPDTLVKEAVTNESGIATFEDIYYGNYTVKEMQAPEGYYIESAGTYPVTVSTDGATYWVPRQGASVENVKIRGNIKFTKVDEEGNALAGAKFDLYKGTEATGDILDTVTTDETGVVEFKDLLYGDYTIREADAPDGYVAADDLTVKITENGETVEAGTAGKVVNETIRGSIKFTKIDEDAYEADPHKIKPIKGSVFMLYKAKLDEEAETPSYVKDGDAIQTVTTGDDGVVEFTDVPYGHYVIEEVTPAAGYNGNSELLHIQITENGKEVSPTEDGYFPNKVITGNVSFKKTDENGEALAGAKFKLSNDHVSYEESSDEEGMVTFSNVLYGTYTLTEVEAPEGYLLWEGNREVRVEEQDTTVEPGDIKNTLIRGSVQVHKASRFDMTPLENAVFKIYTALDEKGNPVDPVEKDGEDYTVTTDGEGNAVFENLPYGTYYVQEAEAPEGFLINTEVKEVKILESKTEPYQLTFTDEKIRGSVEIKKQDAQDETKLQGAKFKLYQLRNEDGEEVLGDVFSEGEVEFEAVTDENGLATLTDVPYGTYYVKEVEAPSGYVLDETPVKVTIKEQDETAKITVLNEKETGSLKIIKTSSDGKVKGFTFRIEDRLHNVIEKTTDENGVILVENLVPGEYHVSEVEDEVSKDYDRPEEAIVEVIYDQTTEVTMHNVKKPEKEEGQPAQPASPGTGNDKNTSGNKAVQTGDSAEIGISLIGLLASAVVLGSLLRRKRLR